MQAKMVGVEHYFIVATALSAIGLIGVLRNRRNAMALLLALQVMLIGLALLFAAAAQFHGYLSGQAMALFVLLIGGAQAALGVALALCFYRTHGSVDADAAEAMRG
ncbi:MAG: NADH-quinone oxidoreductase subunit NuoK [Pseudomonadota bacterium]